MAKVKEDVTVSSEEKPQEEVQAEVQAEVMSFEKFVDNEVGRVSPYMKAMLGVTFKGTLKTARDWSKEPEVAKLMKKE